MLPKDLRLPSAQIIIVVQKGKRTVSNSFQCIWMTNALTRSRFAFVVSKSIDKRAVQRNRIKRYLSEAIIQLRQDLPVSVDAVIIVRSKELTSLEKTKNELVYLLTKTGMYHVS